MSPLQLSPLEAIVLTALAVYGLWHVFADMWGAFFAGRAAGRHFSTVLVVVRNLEQQIEAVVRELVREIDTADEYYEVLVIDWASQDLTPVILTRLAEELPAVRVAEAGPEVRPLLAAAPLCTGNVIHVFDLVNRLTCEEFLAGLRRLIKGK